MTAEYFDEWYADIDRSASRQELFTRALGVPDEVSPSNQLPLSGLQEIADLLRVAHNGLLVDLGCGRGGPGMWLARRLRCRLLGVDFSAEAVRQANLRRVLFGLDEQAAFRVGTLAVSGLDSRCADALVCVDAFQFGGDGSQTAAEFRRVLRPGARLVVTTWEAVDPTDEAVPPRIRAVRLRASLQSAGFAEIHLLERPEWHEAARTFWTQVTARQRGDDPAMQSTYDEGLRSLATHDKLRRVMATAVAPAGSRLSNRRAPSPTG